MSKSLRQRMTPQRISTPYDEQQRQHESYSLTALNSPLSYQQQFSSPSSSSIKKELNGTPTLFFTPTKPPSEQYSCNDVSHQSSATSSSSYLPTPTFVRSNSSSISIDDGKIAANHRFGSNSDDPQSWWKQRVLLIIGLMCLVAPWMRHSRVQWEVHQLKEELVKLQNDQRRLQSRLRTQNDAFAKVTSDVTNYQSKNNDLLKQLRNHGDHYHDFDADHYKIQSIIEDAYLKRIDVLEKEVQRMADRQLMSRGYGTAFRRSDAIRVEIILKHDVSTFGNKLIMELGPMNFLSHAIELFLMLVEHKHYYDNLLLMHRSMGSSIISTVPMDSDTLQVVTSNIMKKGHPVIGSADDKNSPIESNRENTFMMDQLAMLEHTEDYPIQKYSVLFADKGPHFYIQMDEQKVNMKKGEKQETCFGQIVEGQGILDYMSNHHDNNFRGMYMVGIETVQVIQPIVVVEGSGDTQQQRHTDRMIGIDPKYTITEVTM